MARETMYYWEHDTDQSRRLRSGRARTAAAVAHAAGGEVGVIYDAGQDSPLRIVAVEVGATIEQTAQALTAAARRIVSR